MSTRKLLSLLIGLAALTLPSGAAASYHRPPGPAKFLLYVKGAQSTTFDDPVHDTSSDCYHRYSGYDRGSETISFHSRSPRRVTIMVLGNTAVVSYGNGLEGESLPLTTTIHRTYKSVQNDAPGKCGGGGPSHTDTGKDCGSVHPDWDTQLAFEARSRLGLTVGSSLLASGKQGFEDCPGSAPLESDGTTPQYGALTEITGRLAPRKLLRLKKGKTLVVNARGSFHRSPEPWMKRSQNVHWQVRILRTK